MQKSFWIPGRASFRRLARNDNRIFSNRSNCSQLFRRRHDLAALFTGAELYVVEKILVRFGHRVEGIVFDDKTLLVQQVVAFLAVPLKAIDLAGAAFAL